MKNKFSDSILSNNDIKVMNTVSIPNVISNGIVSLVSNVIRVELAMWVIEYRHHVIHQTMVHFYFQRIK